MDIKNIALVISVVSSFLTPFIGSSTNIALPSIGKEFSMDAVVLSWVSTSYLLSAAIFLVPFGKIADIYGRKKIFLYGTIISTIASVLSAISFTPLFLIFSRVLHGIGNSMVFGTGMAILVSVFPANQRGRVVGITTASVYTGLSCGPFLGGFLTQHLGWRSIFLFNVPPCLLIIFLVLWGLKDEWLDSKGDSFDLIGSLIYGITLISLIYGFSILPSLNGIILTIIGIVLIFIFIKFEAQAKKPVFDINLLKNNIVFAYSNLAALINYSATFAVTFLLSLYLQYVKGMSPQHTGLILISQPIVMAIFSPVAGRYSDKIEPRILSSLGMGFSVIGLLLLILLSETSHTAYIVFSLFVLGFGFALFSSPNTNAVMSSVERRFYGIASGTLGTMRLVGQMFSMGIAMLIFAIFIGKAKITPEYFHLFLKSIKTVFIVFSVLCFCGIFASLARGKVR